MASKELMNVLRSAKQLLKLTNHLLHCSTSIRKRKSYWFIGI